MNKETIFKSIGILVIIILVFSGLSRLLIGQSETLAEYREKHSQPTKEVSSREPIETNAPISTIEDVPLKDAIPSNRTIYQTDFYYEPLTDELIEYITGKSYPLEPTEAISYGDLVYLHVLHYDFNSELTEGELICNAEIAADLAEIFYELYLNEYHIEKMVLIDAYDGDDALSMEDNNTSCFNYRKIEGSSNLSKHAYGLAIDINPLYNPYITYHKNGSSKVSPANGEAYVDRQAAFPYKIDETDLCYRLFTEHGFTWGGNWNSSKDYQHFQKIVP